MQVLIILDALLPSSPLSPLGSDSFSFSFPPFLLLPLKTVSRSIHPPAPHSTAQKAPEAPPSSARTSSLAARTSCLAACTPCLPFLSPRVWAREDSCTTVNPKASPARHPVRGRAAKLVVRRASDMELCGKQQGIPTEVKRPELGPYQGTQLG